MEINNPDLNTQLGNHTKPFVAIWMVTYNHESYIALAIESIVTQQTNFDFKLFIGEDCSTDTTRKICQEYKKKYPDIIELILHEKNIGASANGIFMYKHCFKFRSKYIALCEGDDYWTDPLKLQKQVDFLENNPTYSICWTKYKALNDSKGNTKLEDTEWVDIFEHNKNFEINLNNIFTPYCTYTLTCVFRRDTFDINLFEKLKYVKDNTLYTLCLSKGNGIVLNFYSAVYRMHEGGVYSSASNFNKNYFSYQNLKEIVEKIPGCDNANLRHIRNYLFIDSFKQHPNQKTRSYINLILDAFTIFGIKKTLLLIKKKYKGEFTQK